MTIYIKLLTVGIIIVPSIAIIAEILSGALGVDSEVLETARDVLFNLISSCIDDQRP